ncbi:MAG TPA: class I SAM-dependent methyltransferase [Stellaceae bacterium]|nr:class I SAM-dependent methyltransferase [Stellaceae bacterium]
MGLGQFGVPEPLALFLKRRLDLRTFVETGTFGGATAAWAARHFAKVYSIDASEKFWREARQRYAALDNVTFALGDSPQQLAALMPRFERPLFWLDAHWCGSDTAGSAMECPLLEELAAVAAAGLAQPAILIDDARLFLEPPPAPHRWEQWPDIAAVLAALQKCGALYVGVRDDVIVAVPAALRAELTAFWRAQPAASALPPERKPLLRGFLKKHRGRP